jgi:predicted transglutaminase-like cysteine proteinase
MFRKNIRVLLVALASTLACGTAGAIEGTAAEPSGGHAQEFGPTLPPIGYVKFCAVSPEECKGKLSDSGSRFALTPQRWQELYQVNTLVNAKVRPVSDQELYGQPELWALPNDAGDCEDYLLLKKKYLENIGFPPSALRITVVLDERQEGHAVLTVAALEGDFVLDNRRNDILRWNATGYTFLKRQSHDNPKRWVALIEKPPSATAVLSAIPKR